MQLPRPRCRQSKAVPDQLHRIFRAADCAFELRVFDRLQHLFELRSRRVAGRDEFAPGEKGTAAAPPPAGMDS